jgi:hypothetical protein
MIGRRRASPEPTPEPRPEPSDRPALVAAAVHYRIGDPATEPLRPTGGVSRTRQNAAWGNYDKAGELWYAANYLGSALSKVRIIAAKKTPGMADPEPVDTGPAADLAASFLGGLTEAPGHLKTMGIHTMVPGESWIVAETRDGQDDWSVLSESEVTVSSDPRQPMVTVLGQDGRTRALSQGTLVIRTWNQHPRFRAQADSSAMGAERILEEIVLLDDYMYATLVSRLAMAGLLVMPQEVQLAQPPGAPEPPPGMSHFQFYLSQAISAAISNPRAPSARTPILVQPPAEFADKIRLVNTDSAITRDFSDLRETAIRRLARSLALPPEVLLGMSDSNHWSAWATDESTVKVHIEPVIAAICRAGTKGYLRPGLGSKFQDHILWYDTTGLQLRPDRSQQALDAYDRHELDGEDLRDELGLGDRRPPEGAQLQRQVLLQVLRGFPQLAEHLLPALGLKSVVTVQAPAQPPATATSDRADDRALPATDDAAAEGRGETPVTAALVAAADVVMTTALTRAGTVWVSRGSRTERRRDRYSAVPPETLYLTHQLPSEALPSTVLLGDGIAKQASRIAAMHGGDPDRIATTLTAYASELLDQRRAYDPAELERRLASCTG